MKNTAKNNNKISYTKVGFLVPTVYCCFTALLMATVYAVGNSIIVLSQPLTQLVMKAGLISLFVAPSALIVCGSLSMRHRNKYPAAPFFYNQLPLVLSFLVLGLQVVYMATLTL